MKKHYKKIIVIFLGIIVMFFVIKKLNNKSDEVVASSMDEIKIVEINNVEIETKKETLKVDLKGEVLNPGVYELEVGSRIIDVIEMSGGLTENSNTRNVNLSKKLTDEMVIYIPNINEISETVENTVSVISSDTKSLININTASKEELMTLTGIGESKALLIIEYRKNNHFDKIEDIMNISGISEATYNKFKDEITV